MVLPIPSEGERAGVGFRRVVYPSLMNQTLEKILRTTWTEPRHFFFWIALLSLSGFAGIVAGTGLAGTSSLLALFAVGCCVCFVVSVSFFVLAWIPPLRGGLSKLLSYRFLVLGCL